MAFILALGLLLVLAGLALLLNVLGAGDLVIRRVTSRPLGELAPGFAATRGGFRTYATLVISIGVVCAALGTAGWSTPLAAALFGLGVLTFVVASAVAIAGEVRTYRGLSR